jgi:N-acetylmuramoyl-L-alanine amidase
MRSIILLCLASAGLTIGLTAFGGGVEADQEALAPLPPVDLVDVEFAEASDEASVDTPPTPSTDPAVPEAAPAPDVEEPVRSSWRSRRNRYPAPDFTPAEWQPPEGPVRIALQAGHWRAHEAPDELDGLKTGGTHAAGIAEWEVNLALAERTGEMLEALGYEVDILPAVVPPDYHAHLFIAIHADGAEDPSARGYRVAAPSRDYTGRAQEMVDLLRDTYGEATGLRRLPDVTRRMRNYYAFNVRRYEHSLDPRTVALILETGFLTSPSDREIIVDDPDRVARGIVEAVKAFPVTALAADSESPRSAAPSATPGR